MSGRTRICSRSRRPASSPESPAAFASDSGTPVNYASVDADGYDWVLDNDQGQPENVLYAVGAADSPSPGLNPVARFGDYGQDMTLGPDGALYISDNDGHHPVPDHRRAVGEVLDGGDPGAVLRRRLRDRRTRRLRLVHRRRR